MPNAKTETTIPLYCSLCPKNPQFSDVSHLLTHISSKSHLSHRFKLQIRAQSEASAKQRLADFDSWYSVNNLDVMLSNRLAAKEQKKATKDRKSRVSAALVTKMEKQELVIKPSLGATPVYHAPIPRMHLWPTGNDSNSRSSASISEWHPSPVYATPTARRLVPNFTIGETSGGAQIDPKLKTLETPWKPENEGEEEPEAKLTDSMKLKGVHWPGMDLFDSATPGMKRKRNQRKDSSILENMIATSAEVTTDEIVYNLDGTVSHVRDIFGPLSCDTTPIKANPTPKKRKPRKQALKNLDVNAPRTRVSRAKKRALIASPQKDYAVSQKRRDKHGVQERNRNTPLTLNPLASFGRKFADDDDEFDMTIANTGSTDGPGGKKNSFNIFQDAPEISPVRTESPLEERSFDFPGAIPPLHSYPNKSLGNLNSPTPVPKSASIRMFGKENGEPELPSRVQVRRTMTTSHIYPPQVFYDPMFSNPLYNPYHQNPYGRSLPYDDQLGYQVSRSPQGYPSTFHGNFKPLNVLPRSPAKNTYGFGPSSSTGNSSRPSSGHGVPSGSKKMDNTSRLGSEQGACGGSSGMFPAIGGSSRPGSSQDVSGGNNKYLNR